MFKALRLHGSGSAAQPALVELGDEELPPGDVTLEVRYSTLNYKDALAITGRGAIIKRAPLTAGIDLAGVVEASSNPAWRPGDEVVVNGWGLGETHDGGLAQKARVEASWLLRPPQGYGLADTMAIGTAGYTAALCVRALMQRHRLTPASGPVLVTGASGGVGMIAVLLLAKLGFEVHASTGREPDALRRLGAAEVIDRATLSAPGRPLQSERWAGVVDTVGSHTLANACAATRWNGAVAACGLAQGADLPATVLPFILRGVTLYGINSVYVANEERTEVWRLLAAHLPGELLTTLAHEIGLGEAIAAAHDLLDGRLCTRAVIDVRRC